jgi:hypothetical protein
LDLGEARSIEEGGSFGDGMVRYWGSVHGVARNLNDA